MDTSSSYGLLFLETSIIRIRRGFLWIREVDFPV